MPHCTNSAEEVCIANSHQISTNTIDQPFPHSQHMPRSRSKATSINSRIISMMSKKPQCQAAADDDDDSSIEDDLKILNEMNIDEDFNAWSEFRNSLAGGRRESLESLMSRSMVSISNTDHSAASITPVVLGVQNKFSASEKSIAECDIDESKGKDSSGIDSELSHSDHAPLDVSFSTLTPGEIRDIRAWNIRLSREIVFSRYYVPEQWELRELKSIETFLELENPREVPRFLNEPGQETTKKTITDIFFPGDHDAKSVILKRGPILYDGVDEREMLLFTHGFLISRMEFNSLLNILFTINSENPEYLNTKQLQKRFNAIDSDQSGFLDRCELREVFKGMGVPIGELALSDIMERFDIDQDGTIELAEFESVMHELEPKKEETWSWGKLGDKLKRLFNHAETKLQCAFPLSDIEKVESINICYSEATQMFANSSWTELVFAIYIKGREDPLIMVCSKPEHRLAWVDAFRTCYVKSIGLKADNGSMAAKEIRGKVGWQHRIIRASIFSLVVCRHLASLKEQLDNPSPDMGIDDQDEYCGYTALHYAVILGDIGCVKLLLHYGARVNLQDFDQKTPLDHAALSENNETMKLLEHHGAKHTHFRGSTQ
mmetsp:Transcript_11818/g.25916  ORF Transcript_11818/g.25916 Transcript_11818/m.25916 type:complete len:605 (-) Transcript_11818:1148-2962(-)